MAEWKKVVVSGSAISQLDNDAGYLTTGTLGDFVSGSGAAARTKLNSLTSTVLGHVESIDQALGTANNVTFTDLDLDGDFAIDTNKFTVDAATGNTAIAGTLGVTGTITGDVTGDVTGDLTGSVLGNVTGDVTGTADTASYVAGAGVDGDIAGNAGTATKLATARAITTTGDVVLASANFDGSANFTTTATIQAGAVAASMFDATAGTAITGSTTALSSSLAGRITDLDLASYDLQVSDGGAGNGAILNSETLTIQGTSNEVEVAYADGSSAFTIGLPSTITAGLTGNVTGDLTGTASFATKAATLHTGATGVDLTLTGDLTVQGTTTTIDTTNLNVTDQFINLNDGGGDADGGLVVEGAGVSFGWDSSAGRWAFDADGATEGQTTIAQDAFAAAVVTTDDANYRKNGNIRITAGEIFIYTE
jgi:hypothetical protein